MNDTIPQTKSMADKPTYDFVCVTARCSEFRKRIALKGDVPSKPVLCRKCGLGMPLVLRKEKKAA